MSKTGGSGVMPRSHFEERSVPKGFNRGFQWHVPAGSLFLFLVEKSLCFSDCLKPYRACDWQMVGIAFSVPELIPVRVAFTVCPIAHVFRAKI